MEESAKRGEGDLIHIVNFRASHDHVLRLKALAAHNRAILPRSDQLSVGMKVAVRPFSHAVFFTMYLNSWRSSAACSMVLNL